MHRCRLQAASAFLNRAPLVLRTERTAGWPALRWIRQETSLSAIARRAARLIRLSVTPAARPGTRKARWEQRPACSRAVALRQVVCRDGAITPPCASIRAMTARSGIPTNTFLSAARSTGIPSSDLLNSPAAPQDPTSRSLHRPPRKRYSREPVRAMLSLQQRPPVSPAPSR